MDTYDLLEHNNNLTSYYYFSNIFTDEQIEKIKELFNKYNKIEGNVSGTVDLSYRVSNISWFPVNEETKFIYDTLCNLAKTANSRMWKFNVTNNKEQIQVAEYKADPDGVHNGHYDWHMDFGNDTASTRKLSVSVQLSDPSEYEGGDLELMINRAHIKVPREKGTIIFFPSYITHRVTKVTSGKRNSLVTWFHGPTFV
jgi:PKHD-type hydroxylase